MGDISKGHTWADGDTVTGALLNSTVDDSTLTNAAVTSKTAAGSLAGADQFLIYQASGAGLRSVTYTILSAAVLASAATTANRKAVNQVAHSFIVGDVIGRSKAGTNYAKARAAYLQQTFVTTDVDTTNDRLALPSGTVTALTDGDKVFFTSGTTLPAALITSRFYYVKKFDTTHVEIYKEAALSNKVDFTDTGTGTHTMHYGLPLWNAVGVVDAITDANNFSVTYAGEVTTLSGLTDGAVYFLSPTTAGTVTASPPTSEGQLAVPVYVATSATTAVVWGGKPLTLSPYSVRDDHMADQSVTRRALDSTLRQTLDRNIGADRQMVLAGAVDANGYANFLSPGSGLQVALAATATPLIVSFANGFDDTNGYNYVERISTDQTFNSLPASTEAVFLYIDRGASGTLTYGFTKQPPEYGFAKSLFRNRGCVPKLSSDSGNPDYLITSSTISGGAIPSRAFDGVGGNGWQATATTGYLACQFSTTRLINAVSISMPTSPTFGPNAFALEYSDNGSSWTSVGSPQTGVTWSTLTQLFTFPTAAAAHAYWRINVTANNGGASLIIYEANFHEAVDHYYVIPEAKMYAYSGGAWGQVNRVFVGECKTSASSVSSGNIYTYALRGLYVSDIFYVAATTAYTKRHNIGTNWVTVNSKLRQWASANWPADAQYDGLVAAGFSVTLGQSDFDQRADRTLLTLDTSTYVTNAASGFYPSRYCAGSDGAITYGQGQIFVRRSF